MLSLLLSCILLFSVNGGIEYVNAQCSSVAADGYKYEIPVSGPLEASGITGGTNYFYRFMLCAQLPTGCKMVLGQVVCQEWGDRGTTEQIYCGKFTTQAIKPLDKGQGVGLEYSGGLADRTTAIAVLCDPTAEEPTRIEVSNPGLSYQFTVYWKHGCGKDENGNIIIPGKGKEGLSLGSILLIILLCVTVTYFAGGIVFNKFKREKTGTEIIPNRDCWFAIPGLVKDGVKFTIHKIRGNPSSQGYQGVP
jgi:hypothetical protein